MTQQEQKELDKYKNLYELTDQQRKDWADQCIKERQEVQRLQSTISDLRAQLTRLENPPNNIDY